MTRKTTPRTAWAVEAVSRRSVPPGARVRSQSRLACADGRVDAGALAHLPALRRHAQGSDSRISPRPSSALPVTLRRDSAVSPAGSGYSPPDAPAVSVAVSRTRLQGPARPRLSAPFVPDPPPAPRRRSRRSGSRRRRRRVARGPGGRRRSWAARRRGPGRGRRRRRYPLRRRRFFPSLVLSPLTGPTLGLEPGRDGRDRNR